MRRPGMDMWAHAQNEFVLGPRTRAERSPGDLAEVVTQGRELHAPHLRMIDDAFLSLAAGEAGRVALFMPPRHGKSRRVRWAILWWLMRHPDKRVMVASYGQTLAESHGRWLRDTIAAYPELVGFRLRASSRAASRWDIEGTEGGLLATSVGGAGTGTGADLLVIDDPVKDAADAESLLMQERTWDWWTAVAQTRLEPAGKVCLIQTRWSPGDLGGRILTGEQQGWRVIDLPALAMTPDEYRALELDPVPDPLGRAPGEALWPERYPADALAVKRRSMGERVFWALYQQQPRPPEGVLLSRADLAAARVLNPAAPVRVAVAVDPSGGGRDTAGIIGGHLGEDQRLYFTDDRSGVMPSDQWARAACLLAFELGAEQIVAEKNYGGDMVKLTIATAWKALADEGAVTGVMPDIKMVSSRRGKFLRAEPIAQQIREVNVLFVPGLQLMEHEWTTWSPESSTSPGRIDASVHLAYALLPTPGGDGRVLAPVGRGGGRSRGGAASRYGRPIGK